MHPLRFRQVVDERNDVQPVQPFDWSLMPIALGIATASLEGIGLVRVL